MGDSYIQGGNNYGKIVSIDDTDYLVQGKPDDPLTMFRTVNELLECERDNAQRLMKQRCDTDEVLEE